STIQLRHLLESLAELMTKTLKSESAAFFVYSGEHSVISVGTEQYRKLPLKELRQLESFRAPVFAGDPMLDASTHRLLMSYRIAIMVPLWRDNETIGFLCLGEHRTSQYSHRDIRVLHTIAGELVIGIQNALSVQEVRDVNTHLQQRIDAAT